MMGTPIIRDLHSPWTYAVAAMLLVALPGWATLQHLTAPTVAQRAAREMATTDPRWTGPADMFDIVRPTHSVPAVAPRTACPRPAWYAGLARLYAIVRDTVLPPAPTALPWAGPVDMYYIRGPSAPRSTPTSQTGL